MNKEKILKDPEVYDVVKYTGVDLGGDRRAIVLAIREPGGPTPHLDLAVAFPGGICLHLNVPHGQGPNGFWRKVQ